MKMIEDKYIKVGTTFIGNVNNEEFTITKIVTDAVSETKTVCYSTKNGEFQLGYETFRRLNARVKPKRT